MQTREGVLGSSRSMIWRVLVMLFIVGNLAGAAYAAVLGELLHMGVHAALLLLTAYLVWRFSGRDLARH